MDSVLVAGALDGLLAALVVGVASALAFTELDVADEVGAGVGGEMVATKSMKAR